MSDQIDQKTPATLRTPAEKAMKQTSKTEAERQDLSTPDSGEKEPAVFSADANHAVPA
jgi:hypothetical protein